MYIASILSTLITPICYSLFIFAVDFFSEGADLFLFIDIYYNYLQLFATTTELFKFIIIYISELVESNLVTIIERSDSNDNHLARFLS